MCIRDSLLIVFSDGWDSNISDAARELLYGLNPLDYFFWGVKTPLRRLNENVYVYNINFHFVNALFHSLRQSLLTITETVVVMPNAFGKYF